MGRNTSIYNATRSMSSNIQSNMAKEKILKQINKERYEEDYMNGFCWPPRSYTCSFCKREFRSAQALGGHMNVHRKDRARLRQYSPSGDHHYHGQFTSTFLNLNLKPNSSPNTNPIPDPNPSFLIPSSSSYVSTNEISSPMFATNLSALCKVVNEDPMLSMKERSDLAKRNKYEKSSYGVGSIFHGFEERENVCKSGGSEKAEESTSVRLELEIGLLGHSKGDNLDLELRLGYA